MLEWIKRMMLLSEQDKALKEIRSFQLKPSVRDNLESEVVDEICKEMMAIKIDIYK